MENVKLSMYFKLGGIVVGAISAVTLISKYPFHVGFLALGAAIYFVGEYLQKQGN